MRSGTGIELNSKTIVMNKLLLRNMILLLTPICICTVGLLSGCTNDGVENTRLQSTKATLTLTEYYNDTGAATNLSWGAGDQVAILADGLGEKVQASPILPGSGSSMFLFTFEAPVYSAVRVVCYYPSDADVRYADGILQTTIPTEQNGKIVPCLVGSGVGRVSSYDGFDLELTQCFCILYIGIPQGGYSISRIDVTGNGNEAIAGEVSIGLEDGTVSASAESIAVVLSEPVDCSAGAQLVGVMIAPVTLLQGYTVILTDTEGNTYSMKSNDPVALQAGKRVDTSSIPSRTVSLGTYNLWVSMSDWSSRRQKLARSICDNKWDIFGFQEGSGTIKDELPGLVGDLGRSYEWWFVGRDSQDGSQGESIGIAYDPDRFELSDKHFFWISETPDELSYGWDEQSYHRIACCATVKDKVYDEQFFMMVTHSPLAANARNEGAKLLIEREKLYNTQNLPSILVGDMNANMDEQSAVTLRTHWSDAFLSIDPEYRSGPIGTFNNNDTHKDMYVSSARIDYIYHRGSTMDITSYRCDNTIYGGTYPSDHCPLTIQMHPGSATSSSAIAPLRRP